MGISNSKIKKMKGYKLILLLTTVGLIVWSVGKLDALSYVNLKHNTLDVDVSHVQNIEPNIQIYFIYRSDLAPQRIFDTILIYDDLKIVNQIPDNYGENGIIVKYVDYKKTIPLQYKFTQWHKHKYEISLASSKDELYISSNVKGKYSITRMDTIKLW